LSLEQVYDRPVKFGFKLLAELRMRDPSLGLRDAAKAIGYSYQAVLNWLKNPEYQRYETWLIEKRLDDLPPELQRTRAEVAERFDTYAGDMQERLLTILDTTSNELLQAKIAESWLDRAGHSPVRRLETKGAHITLTADLVRMLEERAREAGLGPS